MGLQAGALSPPIPENRIIILEADVSGSCTPALLSFLCPFTAGELKQVPSPPVTRGYPHFQPPILGLHPKAEAAVRITALPGAKIVMLNLKKEQNNRC